MDYALWAKIAEMGWLGMALSEEAGGVGYTEVEEMLVFRELGRVCAPIEIMASVLAGKICDEAGCFELAGEFARGETVASIAVSGDYNRPADDLNDHVIFGTDEARYTVRLMEGRAKLLDLEGLNVQAHSTVDKSIRMGKCDLSGADLIAETDSSRISDTANLLVSSLFQGIAEQVTNDIVEYAKIRETFGRPIGTYQAVSHPIANMKIRAEASRAQLFYAALVLANGGGSRDVNLHLSSARLLCEESARQNVKDNIQLHGGIAVTDEFVAHFYLKRTLVLQRLISNKFAQTELVLNAEMSPF